jgi:hypothetical protein
MAAALAERHGSQGVQSFALRPVPHGVRAVEPGAAVPAGAA